MRWLAGIIAVVVLGCAPPSPPPPIPPTVTVISCAINELQISHTVYPHEAGYFRVHWYDPPVLTPWQWMEAGVGYRFVGFGRGQVEYTAELDEVEVLHAIGGFWDFGWYPSCTQRAGTT